MAIRDGVDVGLLGVLRGGIRPRSKQEVLAWTLLGTAIGSLAIDAGWGDEEVLAVCRAATAGSDQVLAPLNAHEQLACKLMALSVSSIVPRDQAVFLALCGVTLQQIRAAAGDPKAIEKLRELTEAIGPHVTEGD